MRSFDVAQEDVWGWQTSPTAGALRLGPLWLLCDQEVEDEAVHGAAGVAGLEGGAARPGGGEALCPEEAVLAVGGKGGVAGGDLIGAAVFRLLSPLSPLAFRLGGEGDGGERRDADAQGT